MKPEFHGRVRRHRPGRIESCARTAPRAPGCESSTSCGRSGGGRRDDVPPVLDLSDRPRPSRLICVARSCPRSAHIWEASEFRRPRRLQTRHRRATALWRRIEATGFDWISVWDHFYFLRSYDGPPTRPAARVPEAVAPARRPSLEPEVRVLCGSPRVHRSSNRHPAVLVERHGRTLDHLAVTQSWLGSARMAPWRVRRVRQFRFPSVPVPVFGSAMLDEGSRQSRAAHRGFAKLRRRVLPFA